MHFRLRHNTRWLFNITVGWQGEKGRATVIQIDEEDIPIFLNGSFLLITISERRQAKDSEL
jgi:hypothetical protein